MTEPAEATSNVSGASVFDKDHWALTVGILLGVTLNAFEALAVVTIAPRIAASLNGMGLYGWVFSGFLLASLLGIVVGGQQADSRGPGKPLLVGLLIFGLGLLISGFAPTMPLFILGRVVQGLGGGALGTCLYTAVTLAYPDALRPRIIALMSTAWVLPALLGPGVAGFLADLFSWRFVFWGMVPLLALVVVLTTPAFGGLKRRRVVKAEDTSLLYAFSLVLGSGLFLFSLTATLGLAVPVGIFGAALSYYSLRRVAPTGTLRLAAGLPSVIAARGTFYAAFVGVEAFLALALTDLHGFSASVTGIAIAAGALGWTAASWAQDRLDARLSDEQKTDGRRGRVLVGTLLLSAGIALQFVALYAPALPLALTIIGWSLCGFGVGLAHSSSSVLAFALAPTGEEGKIAASLQVADTFTAALSAGLGGALLGFASAHGFETAPSIAFAFGSSVIFVLIAVLAAYRIQPSGKKPLSVSSTL